jgi:hypothetical protein
MAPGGAAYGAMEDGAIAVAGDRQPVRRCGVVARTPQENTDKIPG